MNFQARSNKTQRTAIQIAISFQGHRISQSTCFQKSETLVVLILKMNLTMVSFKVKKSWTKTNSPITTLSDGEQVTRKYLRNLKVSKSTVPDTRGNNQRHCKALHLEKMKEWCRSRRTVLMHSWNLQWAKARQQRIHKSNSISPKWCRLACFHNSLNNEELLLSKRLRLWKSRRRTWSMITKNIRIWSKLLIWRIQKRRRIWWNLKRKQFRPIQTESS